MIRKTGLIRTMAEAQALYASEIRRVKDLVNRYLPDPRVFDVSVTSQRLPDGMMVFKPAIYAKDGKTVTTEASIEIIPHVGGEYVYEQFMDLDAEFRIDWKLGLLEQFTEEWFYEKFSKELITANELIERIRKIEPAKADCSVHTPPDNTTLDILSNKTQELPESNPPSESETPFFFTDVKQLKVKKNKKKKSEKTKSSKSKRK